MWVSFLSLYFWRFFPSLCLFLSSVSHSFCPSVLFLCCLLSIDICLGPSFLYLFWFVCLSLSFSLCSW